MFNQSHIVAELLRLMIVGEHPVDLKLVRLCAEKLHCGAYAQRNAELVDKVALLDQGHLFDVPPRLMSDLRRDALQTLARVEPPAAYGRAEG